MLAGEFRVVTVAYMTLRHPEYASPDGYSCDANTTPRGDVQSRLVRLEGQIYEIVAAEQGIIFIAVFGLPPWSHEDDAARAVRAALTLHREWGALGLTSSTGIATGRIFCGIFQTKTDRAVLALVGPIMNLAARLMQLNAGVVCDAGTRQSGRQSDRIFARQLTPQTIKGKAAPIKAFAAYDVGGSTWQARSVRRIDRDWTRAGAAVSCRRAWRRLVREFSAVVVIEGDAGSARRRLSIVCSPKRTTKAWSSWPALATARTRRRPISRGAAFFWICSAQSDLTLRAAAARSSLPGIGRRLRARAAHGKTTIRLGAFAHLAPLLEDMLGLEVVDNHETGAPSRAGKGRCARRICSMDLLREAARRRSDCRGHGGHALARSDFAEFLRRVGSVSGTAHADRHHPAAPTCSPGRSQKRLAQVEDVQWLRLEPMNIEETGRSSRERSAPEARMTIWPRCSAIEPAETRFSLENCHEWPSPIDFFSLTAPFRRDRLSPPRKTNLDDLLERQGLPSTIEGVIRASARRPQSSRNSRSCALRASSAKASIGNCAPWARRRSRPAEVARSLAVLPRLGVIEPSDRAPDEFAFRHAVLRDVVYNAMSFAERRQIHDLVGSCIESNPHTEDVSALLGHHFLQANRAEKAMRHFITAGEVAIRRFAHAEAAAVLMRAYELDREFQDTALG